LNSKIILLLGGLLSAAVVFFCLKDQYLADNKQLIQHTIKQENKPSTITKQIKKIKPPKLIYTNTRIEASLNPKEKLNINMADTNSTFITYHDDINSSKWYKLSQSLINFFQTNHINNAKISAYNQTIKINTTFDDNKTYQEYKKIISEFKDINISDNSKFIIKKTKEEPKKDFRETKNKTNQNTKADTKKIKQIQKDINKIIKNHPIYFKFGSDKITANGKKTLNKIIKLIKSYKEPLSITIEGHTNAVGNEDYNKLLSKKRADAVRRYILNNTKNIKSVSTIGYGSQKPLYKNPKDKRNRRVQIIINKGKY